MKKPIHLIIIFFAITLFIACGKQKEKKQEHSQTEKTEEHQHIESNNVSLNNGELWMANIETTQGIDNMVDLMNSFSDKKSVEAYAKLNRYLRGGGMILFDTRDGDIAGYGGQTPEGRMLQKLALGLDIPPLEPIPQDHVLTRSFYLLQDFPGRHKGRAVWVEAAPVDAELIEGMPFRNLNDGVTPVVIGGNDWAAAWAVDNNGSYLFRVGRGYTGERQREIAYRFGVNLMMHVLTGNYKSDQVHVPALLDRLGQ